MKGIGLYATRNDTGRRWEMVSWRDLGMPKYKAAAAGCCTVLHTLANFVSSKGGEVGENGEG